MENEVFLSNFQQVITNHITFWAKVLEGYAMNLFIILAGIALIVNIILIILESGGGIDINKIMSFVIKFAFVTGFFFFLLQNGLDFANYIVKYFLTIGNESLGYGSDNKGAVENILKAIYKVIGSFNPSFNVGEVVIGGLLILLICILLMIILCNYIYEVTSAFILIYAGYLILAFGATQWTREWVINYFKAVLGIGLKLLTIMFLIGITLEYLEKQAALLSISFELKNGAMILVTVFIMQMLMNKVPDAVAALVSSAWGHMSGLNMATAAATIMAAAQTAKTTMSVMNKAGGAAIEGVQNYRAGLNDSANDYIKNKYPNAAGAAQNDTFTPNNKNMIPGFNSNTSNGSGIMYQLGKGTGWGLGKYNDFKTRNKQPGADNTLNKFGENSSADSSAKPVQNQADSNIKKN